MVTTGCLIAIVCPIWQVYSQRSFCKVSPEAKLILKNVKRQTQGAMIRQVKVLTSLNLGNQ